MLKQEIIDGIHNEYGYYNDFPGPVAARESARRRVPAGDGAVSVQHLSSSREWQLWLIRTGLSPEAHLGVNRAGIYTDFT